MDSVGPSRKEADAQADAWVRLKKERRRDGQYPRSEGRETVPRTHY